MKNKKMTREPMEEFETFEELARAYPNAFCRITWFFCAPCVIGDDKEPCTSYQFDEEYSYQGFAKDFLKEKWDYDCLTELEMEDVTVSVLDGDLLVFDVLMMRDTNETVYLDDKDHSADGEILTSEKDVSCWMVDA